MQDYEAHAHPLKRDHDVLTERAKECLLALDNAAMSDPDSYVQAAILYDNCKQIERAVRKAQWDEKDEEDNWKSESIGAFAKIELPGQKDSWEKKYDDACAKIEEEFFSQNPDHVQQVENLKAQEAQLDAELDELKDEKRAQGFFNFSGKREVKERMAPVKEQRKDIQKQLRALDDVVEAYIKDRINERAEGFVCLSF